MKLTHKQEALLLFMHDREGCACGPRGLSRTQQQLERRGLIERDPEAVVLCDGDGYAVQPERLRIGLRLTDAGRGAVEEMLARSING